MQLFYTFQTLCDRMDPIMMAVTLDHLNISSVSNIMWYFSLKGSIYLLCCDHIQTDRNSHVTGELRKIGFTVLFNSNLQLVSKPFEAPQRSGGLRFMQSGLNHTIVHQSFTKLVRVDSATCRITLPGTSNDCSDLPSCVLN